MKARKELVKSNGNLSIRRQCKLVSISRSNVYYKPASEFPENLSIMWLIDEHYLKHETDARHHTPAKIMVERYLFMGL